MNCLFFVCTDVLGELRKRVNVREQKSLSLLDHVAKVAADHRRNSETERQLFASVVVLLTQRNDGVLDFAGNQIGRQEAPGAAENIRPEHAFQNLRASAPAEEHE